MNDDHMKDMAIKHDLAEPEFLFVWDRFTKALEGISDQGSIDRGIGMGSADFWVKIAGKEWLCEVRPSKGTVSREMPGEDEAVEIGYKIYDEWMRQDGSARDLVRSVCRALLKHMEGK